MVYIMVVTQEEFLLRAKNVHGDKFDYTDTVYVNMRAHVKIKCRRCERTFLQAPKNHLVCGCYKCRNIMSQETFVMKAKSVHGERYSYNDTVYIDASTKLEFGCDVFGHGTFQQSPGAHLSGSGCPKCMNKIESIVFEILFYSEYDVGKSSTVLINKEAEFRYDIVINMTDKNGEIIKVIVKTDGSQHFKTGITLEETQRNDQVKQQCAIDNDYHVIRIDHQYVGNRRVKNINEWFDRLSKSLKKIQVQEELTM